MHEHRTPDEPDTFCEAPAGFIVETYFVLRMVIAGGALLLPVVLVLWSALDPAVGMAGSISAFYYSPARGVFVGAVVSIGVALVAYRGYTRGENRLLNAAGVLAVVVALVPTGDPALPGLDGAGVVHAVAAVGFFVLSALSIFFYGQETVGSLPDPVRRRRYRLAYRALVVLVLALPATALLALPATALLVAGLAGWSVALFAVETAALWAFAAFWLVKTYELARSHTRLRVV